LPRLPAPRARAATGGRGRAASSSWRLGDRTFLIYVHRFARPLGPCTGSYRRAAVSTVSIRPVRRAMPKTLHWATRPPRKRVAGCG
jgi:hypothetical protein